MRRSMDMQISAMTLSMATNTMQEASSPGLRHLDPDTDFKVRRITSCVNEAIHMAANEPSLGLYRIQEHVHRTAPHLASKKKELKVNNKRISETSYDLNLSMDVVHSMRTISNFTRIQEALKTAIEMKRALNAKDEEEREKRDMDMKNAKIANRSISCNEPAEGYICPVCYFALSSQDELISHWQREHNFSECENDVFQEVEMPVDDSVTMATDSIVTGITLEDDNDMTVIHSVLSDDGNDLLKYRGISEAEDVVQDVLDYDCNYSEHHETSASDASREPELCDESDDSTTEISTVVQNETEISVEITTPNPNQTEINSECLQEEISEISTGNCDTSEKESCSNSSTIPADSISEPTLDTRHNIATDVSDCSHEPTSNSLEDVSDGSHETSSNSGSNLHETTRKCVDENN